VSQTSTEEEIIDELHTVAINDPGLHARMCEEIPGFEDDTSTEQEDFDWVRENRADVEAVNDLNYTPEQRENHRRRYGW